MKTSYVYKSDLENEGTESKPSKTAVDVYFKIREESEKIPDSARVVEETPIQEEVQKPVKKPKRKGNKGVLIAGIVAVVLVVGVVAGVFVVKSSREKLRGEYEAFCWNLDTYYISEPETLKTLSLSDVSNLSTSMQGYADKGIDTSVLSEQIANISQYIEDYGTLSELKSPDLDLSGPEFETKLDSIKESLGNNYTIQSLPDSLLEEYRLVVEQLSTYLYVKESLLSVETTASLGRNYLSEDINSITYVANLDELDDIKKHLLDFMTVEELYVESVSAVEAAENSLSEAWNSLYDEEGNEKQLSSEEKAELQQLYDSASTILEELRVQCDGNKEAYDAAKAEWDTYRKSVSGN